MDSRFCSDGVGQDSRSVGTQRQDPRPVLRSIAVAMVLGMVALAAACSPLPTPPDPFGLRPTLGNGEVLLSWIAPGTTPPAGYEVQWITDGGAWVSLPTTSETHTAFTEVTNRAHYSFRVRTAPDGSTPGGEWSKAVRTTYVDLVLPVVRIDTVGDAPILDRENYVNGSVTIEPNGSGFDPYSGTMKIRGRGNSTWVYPKKPYKMKLDSKSPIMGIAAEKDWVLLANAVDQSQLRTWAAGKASEATDLTYTPTFRHVEVVLNGQYNGVYQLTQHNEVGPDRIDIEEMEPEDNSGVELTGGYRIEIDGRLTLNNEPGFHTNAGVPVVIKDPDPATPEQFNYIRNYVQAMENSIYAPNAADPVNGWRHYLDEESFIDHYLVQELTRNQDVYWFSTFFTKERGQDQIMSGPIWDFDRSMGTLKGSVASPPEGFWARGPGTWVNGVFRDPAFVEAVEQRWQELKPDFEGIASQLEPLGQELEPAVLNDAAKWQYTLDETDTPEFLHAWLLARIAWLDTQYGTP